MGYIVSPPQEIENGFFAVFAQTDDADNLAAGFLESRGINVKLFPIAGVSSAVFGGVLGNVGLMSVRAYVCVLEPQVEDAIRALETESGLVD